MASDETRCSRQDSAPAASAEEAQTLAARTRFVLDDQQWASFIDALERPVRENPGLAKLFSKKTVFA